MTHYFILHRVSNRRIIKNIIAVIDTSDLNLRRRYVPIHYSEGVEISLDEEHIWRLDKKLSRISFISLYFDDVYYYQKV